jgi:hypothetical protein
MGTKYITSSNNTYKVYSALITQTGATDPNIIELIELENTIGDISITRMSSGVFNIISRGLFGTEEKCFINIQSTMNRGDDGIFSGYRSYWSNPRLITLETWQIENGPFSKNDFNLSKTPIEIRVYK